MYKWGFYGALLSFAVGVGFATHWRVELETVLFLLLLSFGVGVLWRRSREATAPHLFLVSLCLLFCALGLLRTTLYSNQFGHSPLKAEINQTVALEGIVVREPDYRERTVHLTLETNAELVLVTTDTYQTFSYGDVVRVEGELREPESFVTDLGRTFDYPGYLLARGIEFTISFADVEVLAVGEGNVLLSKLYDIKHMFMDSLERQVGEPMAGLGEGLLLGVKSALGEDIEDNFRKTGIIHIVVLSGYNVMLVVSFILFCFSFFLPLRYRVVAGIAAIIAFALIVGLSATVLRASIMAGLVLIAQTFGKRYDVMRGLFIAGTVMLLINPYLLLYDIGFQLSFMATLGLILFAPHFETALVENKLLGVKTFLVATIATQVAVLPLLLYHIGEVSLIAVVVNVLVLPMVPLAMLLTFLTGVIGLLSLSLATLLAVPTTLSLQYILFVAEWFARLPFAAVSVPAFGGFGVFLMYGLYGLVYGLMQNRTMAHDEFSDWVIEDENETSADESRDSSALVSRGDLPPIFR